MIAAIRRVAGNPSLPVKALPWFIFKLASHFNETIRELYATRPLWTTPIELDNTRLVRFLGREPDTDPDAAVATTLRHWAVLANEGRHVVVKTRKSRGKARPVAGGTDILAAALSIGLRMGWKAVTIRAVAQQLGYTSPLLYEHFRDKEEILTELAIEGQLSLAKDLARDLPADAHAAILSMVERYWSFMLENKQLYRLMNGMDGVPIDREKVTAIAEQTFETATSIVQEWLASSCGDASGAELLFNDLWAVLHGMAALYLDRSAPFDLARAQALPSK
jgi:AcrR family transcriptional regulator